MKAVADMTIAEYALSDDNFSILVQALTKAELVNVLNGTATSRYSLPQMQLSPLFLPSLASAE